MKLRVLALALAILAFFMFVGSPFQQTANAVALVDDAVIAIIIAGLAAMGITFALFGEDYYNAYDWVLGIMDEANINTSGLQYGVNTKGNILLNNRFVVMIKTIAAYIKAKFNLQNNTTTRVQAPTNVALDELTGQVYTPGHVNSVQNFVWGTDVMVWSAAEGVSQSNKEKILRFAGTYYKVCVEYNAEFKAALIIYTSSDGENYSMALGNTPGYTYNGGNAHICLTENNGQVWFYQYEDRPGYSIAYQFLLVTTVDYGATLDVDVGVLDIPTDEDIGDNGGVISLPVPWGDTLPEVIEQIPTLAEDGELADNTDLELENEEEVTEQIDQEATNAESISQDVNDYQVGGLTTVFPFCIPFDLYNFVACLAADPVAPSFTWRFYVPGICDESIEIDLSEFDTAAQILRTMELLFFCVGLAFVTRKIIRG